MRRMSPAPSATSASMPPGPSFTLHARAPELRGEVKVQALQNVLCCNRAARHQLRFALACAGAGGGKQSASYCLSHTASACEHTHISGSTIGLHHTVDISICSHEHQDGVWTALQLESSCRTPRGR